MTPFLEKLAARRRFGMKPGLDTIHALLAALGEPQHKFKAIHVAGTNGKGAVCAILSAALRGVIGRYTSPHLISLNERFFLKGVPVGNATLEHLAERVQKAIDHADDPTLENVTFFEALTAIAFLLYSEIRTDHVILECGLGGRLDATNACESKLSVITRIGLDHCDWLGDTVERIAAEKAGIIRKDVPVVLGANTPEVRAVVEARANEVGAPFFYAPDLASEVEIPEVFPLLGSFNRENAVTALAALKLLGRYYRASYSYEDFVKVSWPGRFQRVGAFIVDGAHNPPAARALVDAIMASNSAAKGFLNLKLNLIFGSCGDKDVSSVLRILAPIVTKAYAVKTNNARSMSVEDLAEKMREVGIPAKACASLEEAISSVRHVPSPFPQTLICGSLFLAGEALYRLGGYPWLRGSFDPSELLEVERK